MLLLEELLLFHGINIIMRAKRIHQAVKERNRNTNTSMKLSIQVKHMQFQYKLAEISHIFVYYTSLTSSFSLRGCQN